MRRLLALTAVLALAAALPVQARVARPVELTSTTVVSTTSSGYVDVPPFGHYADAPMARFLGKRL